MPSLPIALPEGALDCVIGFNSYGSYCMPRACQHRPVARAILGSKVWEPDTIAMIQSTEGSVVHAGTFFGDFLPALARSRPGETVWAFEPNRENYRCAQMTALLNGLENVTLTPAGLHSRSGSGFVRTIHPDGSPMGGKSRLREAAEGPGDHPVRLVSIDEVVDGPVSAIHLDVEGHETSALTGGLETIREFKPLLVLEQLPDPEWVETHLASLGYHRRGSVNGNHVLRAGRF